MSTTMTLRSTTIDPLLRRRDVEQLVGKCRTALVEAVRKGEFPRPIRCGANSVRWLASEIRAWIEARKAERDAGAA